MRNIITALISPYRLSYLRNIVYMLQSCEYRAKPYLSWYWQTNNFSTVAKRRTLVLTKSARMLQFAMAIGSAAQIVLATALIYLEAAHLLVAGIEFGLAMLLSYPVVWAHLIVLPTLIGRFLVVKPKEKRQIARSREVFKNHSATKIAVAGSYGKTTMKELLLTVLSEGKKVAATPANKNVVSSHAIFANKLKGDEDIIIIEFGEGEPGDVERFAATTKPNIGIITGLAPAHLDRYKTLQAAGEDIFSLADYLRGKNVYVNSESPEAKPFIKPEYIQYDSKGVAGWKVEDIKITPDETIFKMKKGKQILNITSGLIGRHQVGPLALAAALADRLGLTKAQIESSMTKTKPFEHRMEPRQLGGAWIIDDTYNGNLEGIRAGLALLSEIKASKKIYVTPGLVDQGQESERVHKTVGKFIARARPDKVVLMKNSVTDWIKTGLKEGNFSGEITIEDNPLEFYSNLDQFVATGDVVLMQNDWTDNYS